MGISIDTPFSIDTPSIERCSPESTLDLLPDPHEAASIECALTIPPLGGYVLFSRS